MTDRQLEIFSNVHSGLPREGPGSKDSTQRAFRQIKGLPTKPTILDVGCGPGAQTVQLARMTAGTIYALDNHGPYIEELAKTVKRLRLTDRVFPVLGDMRALPFAEDEFDLIWAEGCIYTLGVAQGLKQWRPYLKTPGHISFSEITWLRENPPKEVGDFWNDAYPGMRTVDGNKQRIQSAGFDLLDHFVLPESDWWEEYYGPIESKLHVMMEEHRQDAEAMEVLRTEKKEIDLYREYSWCYGYVFYTVCVSKKTE
jgi:SAM-dependent methyltransferase